MPTQQKGKGQGKQKHIPLRTCIACRTTKPKRELLRIVRLQDGHVELDPAGKKGRLEHEFELEVLLHEDREKLEAYRDTLPADT